MNDNTKTYRLGSNEAVSAPGMVRWAINGAAFEKDRDYLIGVITSGWAVPRDAVEKLLLKQVPYTLDGETVVFTA
jgi:hypothetical protein